MELSSCGPTARAPERSGRVRRLRLRDRERPCLLGQHRVRLPPRRDTANRLTVAPGILPASDRARVPPQRPLSGRAVRRAPRPATPVGRRAPQGSGSRGSRACSRLGSWTGFKSGEPDGSGIANWRAATPRPTIRSSAGRRYAGRKGTLGGHGLRPPILSRTPPTIVHSTNRGRDDTANRDVEHSAGVELTTRAVYPRGRAPVDPIRGEG